MDTLTEQITVAVQAADPLSQEGVEGLIARQPHLVVATAGHPASVTVVVTDVIDQDILQTVRVLVRQGDTRVVAVVDRLDGADLLSAVEAGVSGVLRRREADPQQLSAAVHAAASGDGMMSSDLLGALMRRVGQLQREVLSPRGLHLSRLSERETKVLRLVADGLSTAEVAQRLAYSERTIKNIVQDVVTRFQLRNRSHAVAFALREGLI